MTISRPARTLASAVAGLLLAAALVAVAPGRAAADPVYLGRLGGSPYAAESTANPYGRYGSPFSSTSVNNPYGRWGSPFSPEGARNPFTTRGPKIFAQDGTYLGRLNGNTFDPESVANPFGRYGNPYSASSINNPYGRFGNPFSSESPSNPFATRTPILVGD
jgi:hypothetical protein